LNKEESLTFFETRRSKPEKILVPADPFKEPEIREFKTDVLVVGGGVAGCLAAIAAKEAGVEVLVVEKYNVYSSGDAGTGEDHFLAILGTEDWDNPEEFIRAYIAGGRDLPNENRELIRKFAYKLPEITRRLEKMGMPFRDEKTGKYYRVEAFGEGHPYTIQFDGSKFKRIIASSVVDHRIPVINRVMVTTLFTNSGRVAGAAGMHIGDGSFYVFNAKAVVLTTGEGCRIYRSTSGHPFDSWHSPYNTGDGIAMAFRAGAEIANIEFLALTMCAKGYSTPGTHAFFGMNCYLINSKGERFMQRYHPLGERAERSYLTWGIYSEMRAGRGPCYVDARHLSPEDQERLIETLVVDKGPFGDYLRQKGIDLSKEPMEVSISEFHAQCGILINERFETAVSGLYAAGEGTGSTGVSRVAVDGYEAGKEAAAFSSKVELLPILDQDKETEKWRIYSPLKNLQKGSGIGYLEFETRVRDIMSDYVGFERTESSMKKALALLEELRPLTSRLKAGNYHDLMRVLESLNIFLVATLVTVASLQRRETRWGGNLIAPRGDFPNPDPQWAKRTVVLRKGPAHEYDIRFEIRLTEKSEESIVN
jgi:adenylylsulfate reductase subunit A